MLMKIDNKYDVLIPKAVVVPEYYPQLIAEEGDIEDWRFLRLIGVVEMMWPRWSAPEPEALKKVTAIKENDGCLEVVVDLPTDHSDLQAVHDRMREIWRAFGEEGVTLYDKDGVNFEFPGLKTLGTSL